MTAQEKLIQTVRIPVWGISVSVFIVIAVMGFFTTRTIAQSETETKVRTLENASLVLRAEIEKKADKEDVDRIYSILDRIENKLDRQIEKK